MWGFMSSDVGLTLIGSDESRFSGSLTVEGRITRVSTNQFLYTWMCAWEEERGGGQICARTCVFIFVYICAFGVRACVFVCLLWEMGSVCVRARNHRPCTWRGRGRRGGGGGGGVLPAGRLDEAAD